MAHSEHGTAASPAGWPAAREGVYGVVTDHHLGAVRQGSGRSSATGRPPLGSRDVDGTAALGIGLDGGPAARSWQ
eukprot:7698596-Alexandrium_andersonii.AAC.1